MNQDRKSACSVSAFAGKEHQQAAPINVQGQFNAERKAFQSLSAGNRCAHNKNQIRISPVYGNGAKKSRRPHVIEEAGRRIAFLAKRVRPGLSRRDVEKSRERKDGLAEWFCSLFENRLFLLFLYHICDNGTSRKRRSESLEASLFLALATLIFGCNLYRMAYGNYDQHNTFRFFDYAKLAKDSGMSEIRVKRAMKILKLLGLVKVTPIYRTMHDGRKMTDYTIIELTDTVFDLLGLTKEFLSDREDAHIRWQTRENDLERKGRRASLYKPRNPYDKRNNVDNKSHKVDKDISKGCQSLASVKRPSYTGGYNPATDKQVIALAGELITAHLCANMRDAITLACKKLGKPPPN